MGLITKSFLTMTFLALFISNSDATGEGPTTVVSGTWGLADDQFGIEYGDTNDMFAGPFYLLSDGSIIIRDVLNARYKVYSADGSIRKVLKCREISQDVYNEECNFDGNYLQVTTDGNVWVDLSKYKKTKYSLFSPTGQLIKTMSTRPLELGRVKSERLGEKNYRYTIMYPDKTYALNLNIPYKKYIRDGLGRINAVGAKSTRKFNACGKEIGLVNIPDDQRRIIRPEGGGFEEKSEIIAAYGEPVIAPNGDVYTWKRTPDTYSILKWTWVDDPNAPTGPNAPSGLTVTASTSGLYLTWTASPQDPGCVTGYEISRATSAGGIGTTIATVNAGTVKYNDTSATVGTMYYYKIRAVAGSEYSPYSNEASGKR